MSKKIYCTDCLCLVAELENGSKTKKGIVYRCSNCETIIQKIIMASKLNFNNKRESYNDQEVFENLKDIFGGFK